MVNIININIKTNKGVNMTNKAKQVLKQVRDLAEQNQFVAAKNLLNKHSNICDVDSDFWNVYQGLGMLYANKITKGK